MSTALDRIFPHRVCINLDRRPDRWATCTREFEKHGFSVARLSACDGRQVEIPEQWRFGPGAYGCAISHIEAVRQARDRAYDSLLVFEDDVVLPDYFEDLLERFTRELPLDWDMVYFGGMHREDPAPVSRHVARVVSSHSTFAYAIRNTMYDVWLDKIQELTAPVDEMNRSLQKQFAFYCSIPPLAWVSQDYSDILGAEVNHWWLREGLAVDGATSRQMIARTAVLLGPAPPLCPPVVDQFVSQRMRRIFPLVRRIAEMPENLEDMARIVASQGSDYDYWIVSAPDLFIPTWELKSSLLMMRDYDLVVPLHNPLALDPDDSARAMNGDLGPVDTSRYPRVAAASGFPEFTIVKTSACPRFDRVFHSPSRVWRLSL